MNFSRLLLDLRQYRFILDFLYFITHFARTSRRQVHSGLFAPLKITGGRSKEQESQREPPPAINAGNNQRSQQNQADCQHENAEEEPFTPLLRVDVGDANGRFRHLSFFD